MKKQLIERITRYVAPLTRTFALLFAVCAVTSAWAAVKPLVVWNGDFPTSNDGTSTRNGYKLSVKGNTAAADGSKITLKSSNNLGVEILHVDANGNMAVANTPFAAVYNIYNITTSGSRMLGTSIVKNGSSTTYNRTMAGLNGTTFDSWHSGGNSGSEQLNGTFSGNSTTKYSVCFLYRPGTYGTDLYLDGVHVMEADGTKWGADANNVYGVTLGGCGGAETRWNFPSAEISYVAILNSANESDIAAWSLNGLTASATFTDGGTISSETNYSTTGVNLNGGTITVSGAVTAAAIFVQADTTLNMAAGTDKLVSTGPVYIADGVTLRINVTGNPSTYAEGTASSADLITGTLYVSDATIEAGTLAAVSRGKAGIETDTTNNKIKWTYKPMPVWSNGSWAGGIAPTASDLEIAIDSSASATYNAGNVPETYTTVYVTGNGTLSVGENGLKVTTLNVAADATVNMANITATTVTGEGTVIYDGIAPVATDAAWRGTVWIKNYTFSGINLNTYGNEHSLIKLTSTSGTLADSLTCAAPVELVDDGETPALNLVYDSDPGTLTYTLNELRGSGTFKTSGGGWPYATHRVLKWDNFTGKLDIDRGRFAFGSSTFPSDKYRNIFVSENASVEVASGKTWYSYTGYVIGAGATLTVSGDISYGGEDNTDVPNAVSGSGTVVFSGKAPSPTGGKWWTTSGWTGTVWIKNLSVADFNGNLYGNANSTLKLSGVSGYFPESSDCVVPIELSNSGYYYGLYVTDGYSRSDSAPDNVNVIRELKGDGEMWTGNNGDNVWFNVRKWSGFTGKIQLVNKIVVFGDDVPAVGDFNTAGSIYVRANKTVTIASGKQWRADGGIYLEGELQADGVTTTTFTDSTTITTYNTGVFTLVNSNSTQDQSQSYARITGTGTLRYANASGWRTLSRSNFPTNMICEINLKPGVILQAANSEHTIGSLAGDGRIRSDWGGTDNVGDRDLKVLQAKDTEYSGSFDDGTANSSWDRLRDLIVAPGESTSGTLTLSGIQTADNGLKVLANAKAKVTGKWKGATTVAGSLAFGGANGTKIDGAVTTSSGAVLDFTDFTVGDAAPISGTLTLNSNTTIRFPAGVSFPYKLADSVAGVSVLTADKYTIGGVPGTASLMFVGGSAYSEARGTISESINWSEITWANGAAPQMGSDVYVTVTGTGTATLTFETPVVATKANFDVPAGKTLKLSGILIAGEINFTGGGTVVCSAGNTLTGIIKGDSGITIEYPDHTLPAYGSADWTTDDWKGTLVLPKCGNLWNGESGFTQVHDRVPFENYGNTNSFIKVTGFRGYAAKAASQGIPYCKATLVVDSGDTFELNHGTDPIIGARVEAGCKFKKLTGAGKILLDGTSDIAQYIFEDVSTFTGTVEITDPNPDQDVGGKKSFIFNLPEDWEVSTAFPANLVIATGEVTVPAGTTWDIPAGIVLNGNSVLKLGDGSTITRLSSKSSGTLSVPSVSATLTNVMDSVVTAKLDIDLDATLNISDTSLTTLTIPADSVGGTYSNDGTLNLSGCTNLEKLYLVLGESKTFDFDNVTLPEACGDVFYNIGDKRDLDKYSLATKEVGKLSHVTNVCFYAVETPEEYAAGGFAVSNVVDGADVWLIRRNGALIKAKVPEAGDDRTADYRVYDGGRSFAGASCWHEWDFEQTTGTAGIGDKLNDSGACTTNNTDVATNNLVAIINKDSISYQEVTVRDETKIAIPAYAHPKPTDTLTFPTTTGWSAALRCSMPTVTGAGKAVAIAFGDATSGVLGLAATANDFVELFTWTPTDGGTYTTLAQLKVELPSQPSNMHLYVLTVKDNMVTLYRDGEFIHTAQFALSGNITTFMVGDVVGRGEGDGNLPAAATDGYVDYVRLYDKILPEADITGLSLRRPFVSATDLFERGDVDPLGGAWSAMEAWTKTAGRTAVKTLENVPTAGANVTVSVDASTSLDLNIADDVKYGTLIFNGNGRVGLGHTGSERGRIGAEMFVVRSGVELTVDHDAVDFSSAIVGVDSGASLEFNFEAFPFASVTVATNIVLAGSVPDTTSTARYSVRLPNSLPANIDTAEATWDNVSYILAITLDHTAGGTVYYKDGTLTAGMRVYTDPALTDEYETTLFAGDTLVISDASSTGEVSIDDSFNGVLSITRPTVNLASTGSAALAGKTVTVAENCTLNFAGGSFGAMTLDGEGAFAVTANTTVASLSGTVAVNVEDGVTLMLTTTGFVTGGVSGTGTVKLPASLSGSVNFNAYGNAYSTVEVTGLTAGELADGTCNPTLLVSGAAAFSTVGMYTFTKVTGSGNLTFPSGSAVTITELVDYTGTIVNNSSTAVTVTKLTKTDGVFMGGAVLLTKGGTGPVDVTDVEISGTAKYGFWDDNSYILAAAEYNNQRYATVADAITVAGDANLFYITVFETSETLSDRYMFIEEMGVMKVSLKPFAVVNGETITYHNDAQSAIIKVGMTPGYAYDYIEVLVSGNLDIPLNILPSLKIKNTVGAILNFTGFADDCTTSEDDSSGTYTVYTMSNKATVYTWTGNSAQHRWGNQSNWSFVNSSDATVAASRAPGAGDTVIFDTDVADLVIGADLSIATIRVGAAVTIAKEYSAEVAVTATSIVLTDAAATLTVSGVTLSSVPTSGVAGYIVKESSGTYSLAGADTTTGVEVTAASAEAAIASVGVALTPAQKEQGLEESYYKLVATAGSSSGTWVVKAELDPDQVGVNFTTTETPDLTASTARFTIANAKKGLYYSIRTVDNPSAETPTITVVQEQLAEANGPITLEPTLSFGAGNVIYYQLSVSDSAQGSTP